MREDGRHARVNEVQAGSLPGITFYSILYARTQVCSAGGDRGLGGGTGQFQAILAITHGASGVMALGVPVTGTSGVPWWPSSLSEGFDGFTAVHPGLFLGG